MTSGKQTIVETKTGPIEGYVQHGVIVFKGVPFAAPPVGELRWRPPQPVVPWKDIRKTKIFGPAAPQNPLPENPLEVFEVNGPQDEDCLQLNIWSPVLDDKRRPVMVWIHGGAFIIGSAVQAPYEGYRLAAGGDVVVVSINYRLGALGFMHLKELTSGRIPATGNEGLLDQVAALQWVQDNITAFGGDPDNVTVFGESAGAMSIGCLLSMPSAKNLFHKAILQSGAAGTVSALEDGVGMTEQYLSTLGIKPHDVDSLNALTTQHLLVAQQKLGDRVRLSQRRITPFQPLVDGEVIPEWPIDAIAKGCAADIKILAGTNREEWKLFAARDPDLHQMDESGLRARLSAFIPDELVAPLIETYKDGRKQRGEIVSPAELLIAINTDMMFRVPKIRLLEVQHRWNPATFNYLFTWRSPIFDGFLGSCHALEIGFVFGSHGDEFFGSGPEADKLSRDMQSAWLAFSRNGSPDNELIGSWGHYDDQRMTMILNNPCRLESAPFDAERKIWQKCPMRCSNHNNDIHGSEIERWEITDLGISIFNKENI